MSKRAAGVLAVLAAIPSREQKITAPSASGGRRIKIRMKAGCWSTS